MMTIFYLAYLVFNDYAQSRQNQLSDYLEEAFAGLGYETEYAERKPARMVLIMYRPNGNGGIQGIVFDSFYVDKDGKVANEFYVVTDSDEGEIKKVEDSSIKKLENGREV